MHFRDLKRPVLSALAFFWTLVAFSFGYSAYVTNMPATVSAGSWLSATEWNKMVAALQMLDSKLSVFGISAANNVGIGVVSPSAKLDVAWSVKISDGTQGDGKLLTSDANGLTSWTGPGYQVVTASVPAGTTVSASNDVFNTADVTLTPGIWKLDLGYYLYPSVSNGCYDVHVDAVTTSWNVTLIAAMPNLNSETAYAGGRHWYLSTSQLISVGAGSNALVHGRRYGAWCNGAYYTAQAATLTMIATKVR